MLVQSPVSMKPHGGVTGGRTKVLDTLGTSNSDGDSEREDLGGAEYRGQGEAEVPKANDVETKIWKPTVE